MDIELINDLKRRSSMANDDVDAKKSKVCLNEEFLSKSVEELNTNLNVIINKVDQMRHKLNNPIDVIKEHSLNERIKIDLRVEQMVEQINNLRDDVFKKIEHYEKECIDSLSMNKDKSDIVQGFLTETQEFHDKWNNYLSNLEQITDQETYTANKMSKVYENKIPFYNIRLKKFIFNENFLNFVHSEELINEETIGVLKRSDIGKIDLEKYKITAINC